MLPASGPSIHAVPSAPRRALIAAVVESLRDSDLEAIGRRHGVDPAELSSARDAFVAAGAHAVNELPSVDDWMQVTLAVAVGSDSWAGLLSGELPDRLESWIDGDDARRFFFTHKPPGMRLRFGGADRPCRETIFRELETLAQTRVLAAWDRGPYDAEVCQLGGRIGLDLAHRYFTIESLAVVAYQRCRLQGRAELSPSEFSLMLLDRMIRSMTDDSWEAWDVWTKMILTGRIIEMPSQDRPPGRHADAARRTRALLENQPVRLERASSQERDVFARYTARLGPVVEETRRAVQAGTLLWGLREILPFWIIFHWNRMAFSPRRQTALTKLMCWAWSPKDSQPST